MVQSAVILVSKIVIFRTCKIRWFWAKFTSEPQFRKDFLDYNNELEKLGVYVSEGLLGVRYVALIAGGSIISLWERYEGMITGMRENYGAAWFIRAEYLYNEVKNFYKKNPKLNPSNP